MTFKDILVTVGSAVGVTAAIVAGIKINEFYNSTVDTVEKANKIVDTLYKHDADIDNALNVISKLPRISSSTPAPSPQKNT